MAPPSSNRRMTIRQSLVTLGIDNRQVLQNFDTRHDEFNAVIKKHYFRAVLKHHPDKGGNDIDLFRSIQTSFELLRDVHHGTHRQHQRSSRTADNWLFADLFPDAASDSSARNKKTAPSSTTKKKTKDTNDESPEDDDEYFKNDDDEPEFDMESYYANFATTTPSWEYYQEASQEDVPLYRVELAKSDRSKCTQKGKAANCRNVNDTSVGTNENNDASFSIVASSDWKVIQKGEIRVGWMDGQSGSYGGWVHLRCWRVPYKLWLGLPNPDECDDPRSFEHALLSMNDIVLSGIAELSRKDLDSVVRYVMKNQNWARRTTPRKTDDDTSSTPVSDTALSTDNNNNTLERKQQLPPHESSSSAITLAPRQRFVVPIPGKHGASPANAFRDKTFVLTGIFPEIGGGKGLSLGKDKTKAMIMAFGGRVTSAISGKTDVLVVGKEPGMSKVSKARTADNIVMVSLKDLGDGLESGYLRLEDFPVWSREEPMLIQSFSAGYKGSGLALKASKKDLAVAQGFVALAKKIGGKNARASSHKPEKNEKDSIVKRTVARSRGVTQQDLTTSVRKRRSSSTLSEGMPPVPESNPSAIVLVKPKKRTRKQEFSVSCDGCSADCTERSWFYPHVQRDYCDACHTKEATCDEEAVLQCKGRAIEV